LAACNQDGTPHTGQEQEKSLWGELSGSIGDLGTFLPYVLGAVTVAGLNPASIFAGFGLFYIFCGWFYRIPMAVQPMKAASAAVLTYKLTPGEVAAGGLVIGLLLLLLGLTGVVDLISRITPQGVISGIQVGLGLSLAILGLEMVGKQPVLGWSMLVLMLLLLQSRRLPAALLVVLVGTVAHILLNPGLSLPKITLGIHLPGLVIPAAEDFNRAFFMLVLPQLPMTLTNAVLVTTVLSRELFGDRAARVSDRNLCLTMGAANLLAAPFGGYMMCHGSGGVAAHYRFGGRSKYTVYIIGFLLLAVGLFLGTDGASIFALIPDAVLGCLLFYSGVDLAMAARKASERNDFFVVLAVAALSLAINPAVAFIAGFILAKGLEKR